MRRKDTVHISEALHSFVQRYGLEGKLDECSAVTALGNVIGNPMMQYVEKVYVRGGVLFVHVSSSVVRGELAMNRHVLLERLNAAAGNAVIKDIVFR